MRISPATETAALPVADRQRIDRACDRFEAAWRAGERPDLAAFLTGPPGAARERLFRELLALERELRRGAGERPAVAAYRARFPEHAAAVDAVFADDETGVDGSNGACDSQGATRPGAGRARGVGPGGGVARALRAAGYEVEGELGRGGMGVVYRARQAALGRSVAVKVIRAADFADKEERRRFRNEAESVARLDHPNIVPLYEVGRSRGLNYFTMKLVAGASLDRRLDEFTADPRAAARLVAVVAEAVHHAHQRGILHRDLKPANILVDDRGEPHVTDFGLARRIDREGDPTGSGAVVGTPSYMSPEQAAGGPGSLTTATDVYGLGAVLYSVLTGRAPHAGGTVLETLDRVRGAAPERPSRVNRLVPRDLEVICLTCLEKDPRRRYAGARDLADDLRRWLAGRPIAARPAGPAARAWMWCRRHPLPAGLAALLAVAVAGGFAGVTREWQVARREAAKSARVVHYLTDRVLAESSTEVNPAAAGTTLRDMLDRAAARIGGDFPGEPDVEAAVREAIGGAYLSLGEFAPAELHLHAAVLLHARRLGPDHPTTLGAAAKLAATLEGLGRPDEAEALLRRDLGASRRALGPDDPVTLETADRLGALLAKRRSGEAEPLLRRTLDARRRVLPPDHPDALRSVWHLGRLLADLGRFDEAEALAHQYEHGVRCTRGPKHPDNVTALANRGLIRLLRGQPAEAEPFYRMAADEARRILGPEHPAALAAAAEHDRQRRTLGRPPSVEPGETPEELP